MTGLKEPEVDHDLLHLMRMITDMLVNDSASSELLAGEVGRRPGERLIPTASSVSVIWPEKARDRPLPD